MANLPPIEMGQLKLLLSDPKMPEHRILKQVADTIDSKGEKSDASESEAEDQGCPNIFDMFIEAALKTDQTDEVDDDDEAYHVPYHVQLQCRYCAKSYDSSWRLNMHVAVKHATEAELLEKSMRPRPVKRLKSRSGDDVRNKKQRLSPKQEEAREKAEKEKSQDSVDTEKLNTEDSLLAKIMASAEKEESELQKAVDKSQSETEPKAAGSISHSSPSSQTDKSKASENTESSHSDEKLSPEGDHAHKKRNLLAGDPESSSL